MKQPHGQVMLGLTLLATLFVVGCGPRKGPEEYSTLHSFSGIRSDRFEVMVEKMRQFANRHADFVEYVNYGQSVSGKPLSMLKISNRLITDTQDAPAVIMNEAIHGDEFLNITARLPEKFLENNVFQSGFHSFLDKGGVLYLTPVQNPDGYDRVQRENTNGLDLNRDYPLVRANKAGFTQPETTSLVRYVTNDIKSTGRILRLNWDYHCCVGALIYPWGHTTRERMESPDIEKHLEVAKEVKTLFGYQAGTAMEMVNYTALGTSDDYHYETFKSLSFTFEGAYQTEASKLDTHVTMWDGLFRRVVQLSSRRIGPRD